MSTDDKNFVPFNFNDYVSDIFCFVIDDLWYDMIEWFDDLWIKDVWFNDLWIDDFIVVIQQIND
jgi:hypothetical protein